jgi:hypothetical protein
MIDAVYRVRTNNGKQVWAWGGYYRGNKDAMHFEIVCSPADLATGIAAHTLPGGPAPAPDPADPIIIDPEDPVAFEIYILHCTLLGADINPKLWAKAERSSFNHYVWLANTKQKTPEEIRQAIQATARQKGLL